MNTPKVSQERKAYIIRLSSLVANEKHLEDDLKELEDLAQRRFVERALTRTRAAIDELHHHYSRGYSRDGITVRGRV